MPGQRYATGEPVQLGDVVGIGDMFFGKIVCVIGEDERCEEFAVVADWSSHDRGFVVQSPDGATMMCEEPDEMTLLDRA